MSETDDFLRSHRRPDPEPEAEPEPKPQPPRLVTQGVRSAPPRSQPPSPDAILRGIADDWRRPVWTSVA